MKHLLFEIVEATEAAAVAASRLVGSGDKIKIDQVATDAMRKRLNNIIFGAEIVIGEGIKDGSVGLYKGEQVGKYAELLQKTMNTYEIAVDPVEGTTPTAKGGYEAMSVIAIGEKGNLMPIEEFYMEKIAVAASKYAAADLHVNFEDSYPSLVEKVKYRTGKAQLTVCMLDRPRHEALAGKMRSLGCRIRFIQDCDVSGAIAVAMPQSGIDLFIGVGGAPEGVITAAALKCLGGEFIGRLVDDKNYKPVDDKVYDKEDLAKGRVMFAATGITNGSLLRGVRIDGKHIVTHSILMESETKSIKHVESYHGQ
jgi:fructose-1,6-bisphosphatase/sedoheptulose 1,7-bisphosphatase-like protein